MKMPSPLPRSTTLVSPVTIAHAGRSGGLGHRRHHAAERFHGQALFEDEACAEIRRPGPGHRQVVDGAADGQLADVAAGEEQGVDDVAVGGEGQAGTVGGQHGAVVRGRGEADRQRPRTAVRGERDAERRQEEPFDEVSHQPPTAAVRQLHGGVVAQGDGASQIEVVIHGCTPRNGLRDSRSSRCGVSPAMVRPDGIAPGVTQGDSGWQPVGPQVFNFPKPRRFVPPLGRAFVGQHGGGFPNRGVSVISISASGNTHRTVLRPVFKGNCHAPRGIPRWADYSQVAS